MTDIELITAQGLENSQRGNLSYIERAVFAARLEDRGFARTVIIDALATDKTELSKLISVARAVPESVIDAIGPAPKAGRRRWLAFVDLLQNPGAGAPRNRLQRTQSRESRYRYSVLQCTPQRPAYPASTHRHKLEESTGGCFRKGDKDRKAINLAFDNAGEPEFCGVYRLEARSPLLRIPFQTLSRVNRANPTQSPERTWQKKKAPETKFRKPFSSLAA